MSAKVLPKYLNWKCLDNFDKVQNRKIFLVGETNITPFMRAKLSRVFSEMKGQWEQKVKDIFREPEKTHLEIAGGNYTFFFVLPHVMKWIRNRHKFLPVRLHLVERSQDVLDLTVSEYDLMLTTLYAKDSVEKLAKHHLYETARLRYDDAVFLASSVESIDIFGSKQAVLDSHDVLFGRFYSKDQVYEDMQLYSTIPDGREGVRPRVVVDQYFLKYLLMQYSAGIGHVFRSMRYSDSLTVLDEISVSKMQRLSIYRKDLDKYRWIARRFIKYMEYGD